MLPQVKTHPKKLEDYRHLISQELFEEIRNLARELNGLKINIVNSTPKGGGVAEILKSLVPLLKGVGVDANWYTIPPREDFFEITKEIHNALQGKEYSFPFWHRVKYLQHIERSAFLMRDMKADIWVIQDPQPAGVIMYLPNSYKSIFHLHIDLTQPNSECWNFMAGFLARYHKIILTSKDYVKKEIKEKALIIPPAIDPLAEKNKPASLGAAKAILETFDINIDKPLITQVSRFDPWKDPLGVIKAYRIAKKKIPNLQLALLGLFLAKDDPEAMKVFKETEKEAKNDPDIFLFSDPNRLGSLETESFVAAFQAASKVILQKSIREGFGLTVTEAMWRGTPVIGGNVGGIKMQIQNGKNGFLVSTPKEAAKRIVQIINDPKLAERFKAAGKESVKEKFLMPRLLRDYLKVFRGVS